MTKEVVSNGSWTSWCTYEGIEYPQEVTDAIESLNENLIRKLILLECDRLKKSVTVSVNEKKLSAIEMYLEQKNTTLAAELEKYADQLYGKVVPQNVRDFIDMMSDRKPARKPRNSLPAESEKHSEQ